MEGRHPLVIVANEFGYPKLDRLAEWVRSNFERANGIIEASIITERAILFFPSAMFEVVHLEASIDISGPQPTR